jgi:hypothetical protein
MSNGINKIELVLENCESLIIEGKYIGDFIIDNIKTTITRQGCNYIGKYQYCEDLALEISSIANTNYPVPWGGMSDCTLFQRLSNHRDITSIKVYYDDIETPDVLYVEYEAEVENRLGSNNIHQKSYISGLDNLYIVISKDKNISSYFNLYDINNKESMDFKYQMYDIIPMTEI